MDFPETTRLSSRPSLSGWTSEAAVVKATGESSLADGQSKSETSSCGARAADRDDDALPPQDVLAAGELVHQQLVEAHPDEHARACRAGAKVGLRGTYFSSVFR
jgi:hypothetical protein